MRLVKYALVLSVTALTTGAFAQSAPPTERTQEQLQLTLSGDKLIGKDVIGADGNAIGEIKDVTAEAGDRQSAVIVETGGFLGMGARLISVPLSKLRIEGDRIVADLTREQAADMPEYKAPTK
jgi:hypothetical protein